MVASDFEVDITTILGHVRKDLFVVGVVFGIVDEAGELIGSEGDPKVNEDGYKKDNYSEVVFLLEG